MSRENVGQRLRFCPTYLLQAVKSHDAALGRRDAYGQRYLIDFAFDWCGRRAILRSGWIIEHGPDTPRLTTCYPR